MKHFFLTLTLLLTITATGCEARVLDESGNSIKQAQINIENSEVEASVVTIKDLNVKGVIPYIDMDSGKVTYHKNEIKGHDIAIEVDFSVFQVYVKLGEDYDSGTQVEALPTGVSIFDDVTIAPERGYRQDTDNGGLVIGNKFYNGGNGWSGFHMTNEVYILKTRTGKFAKIQFLQAKQGNVDLRYYIQNDHSTNLKTSEGK